MGVISKNYRVQLKVFKAEHASFKGPILACACGIFTGTD